MNARTVLPGVSRIVLYVLLAVVLIFPAIATVAVHAASTISLRAAATINNGTGTTGLTLPKPSGTAAGDVIIAQIVASQSGTSITAPSGWHLIRSTAASAGLKVATYYKVATSSEPSTYRWAFGATETATGGIASFIGVSTTSPIDISSGRVNSGATALFYQITTTYPGDLVLAFVGVAGNSTVTPPSGFTETYDRRALVAPTTGRSAEMSRAPKWVAGLTAVGSAKEDTLAVSNVTQLVALHAAGAVVPTATPTPAPLVIAAVGDMECTTSNCQGVGTIGEVSNIHPSMFFPVGDLVWIGYFSNFLNYYDPSWGIFRSISHPAIGNHDGNAGYYEYWNGSNTSGPAGPTGEGWYSLSKNGWHFVVLDSNCVANDMKVSCAPGSAQITWLQNDLASHKNLCTIAFMHIPYYTSGTTQYPELQTIFQTLYNYHVDLLITGHTHYYQRFYPQDADGNRVANGVTEIVVGTGGGDLSYVQSKPSAPNQAVQIGQVFGVLKLTLYSTSYAYRFIPAPGYSGSDSGSASCH